jgi:hypothetical protein
MNIDTRTAEEKLADEILATDIGYEIPKWEARRKDLESDLATAKSDQVRKWLRKEIGRCDRALMELGAGRLPEFLCPLDNAL